MSYINLFYNTSEYRNKYLGATNMTQAEIKAMLATDTSMATGVPAAEIAENLDSMYNET